MSEYIIAHCVDSVSGVRYDERREEIVRCRDCKEFMNGDLCKLQDEWNEFHWLEVEPDGFCKWASRRES